MVLFDKIFKQGIKPKNEDRNLPSFWADDYCQIEIVLRTNIEQIKKSIKQIDEFTKKTRTEYGFTDIFMRENLPYPTINEELQTDYFESLLIEKGFEKAKKIRYNGHTIINCTKTTSNACSLPCFNFFYDCNNEFINNIWISTSLINSNDHFNKILEALYELGKNCELVLINWNSLELIDLTDRNQIKEYLMSYWK
ncbi:hypothetical protein [Acinetobacter sp. MD2(2019)]|uniref:hypothetical protein n=1 Tax=Acinetobacter sp. MD2(2019) TaxID=2605273 RepID=UPI002D1F018B|nr:hypothetical protein [Acinetobacter sp. MD2(2019)]MEB3753970.1 hypothetical protein [Acinetobacter sp. MD2(2019)]